MAYPKDEMRVSCRGERFQLGDHVWTRNDHKTLGFPVPLTIRRARKNYRCRDCGETIVRGDIHGSDFYEHYCLECCTHEEPERYEEPYTPLTQAEVDKK
jgi:hypothetical protein